MQGAGSLVDRLGRDDYSEAEKVVLNHFFTNIDKNIYCPTEHMPFPVWAFLVGQYSRSDKMMRDRFLEVFDQMKKKVDAGEWPRDQLVTVQDAAEAIAASKHHVISFFFKTAEDFLSKWGVQYGHASLKDADKVRVAIEGISQLVTNFIELPDPELGDYQEKSTRYITFNKQSVIIPPRLKNSGFAQAVKENNDALMESYERWTPFVRDWLAREVVNEKAFKSSAAYKSTLNAKTFDIMRYWLPQGLITSLGATWPTRVAETHVSQMMMHPLEELQSIGRAIWEEGLKITPGLLRHVEPNDYFGQTIPAMYALAEELLTPQVQDYHRGDRDVRRVCLVHHTRDFEDLLLAGILYEFGNGRQFENILIQVQQFNAAERDLVFKEYLSRRGPHDLMLRGTKLGRFLFEYTLDNGAWRDVKRQRVGTQLKQDITAALGFAYPEHLEDCPALRDVKEEYESLMERTTKLYNQVFAQFPRDASYIPAMGHLGRSIYEFHARQSQYAVELRTAEAGHHSYKTLFRDTYREIERVLPRFAAHIRAVMDDGNVGRQKAEEHAAQKAAKQLEDDKKRSSAS
ncbi:FAD-dependent thymidylate synthase [Candidatus Woesearchaeota archaeon]|nr:FAD-dependent thymidylate synthase [Candidatus Woesearchaeota archaeon]